MMRAPLVLSLLAFAVFLGTSGSFEDAYATDFVLTDALSCTGLGGVWNAATSTCTFSSDLSITSSDTLTISFGVTLEFVSGNSLDNRGAITNNGIILISSGSIINRNNAIFINSGTITTTAGGSIDNRNDATFTNSGTITITSAGNNSGRILNRNNSTFTNSGTITLTGSDGNNTGRIFNANNAVFTNSGTITLTGDTGTNSGLLTNSGSSTFTNLQTITITGGSGNDSGRIDKSGSGSFTNSGTITITGNFGSGSGRINNSGSGGFTNNGIISITAGAGSTTNRIVVSGTSSFTNAGNITTDNNFRNVATLTNSGTITVGNDFRNNNVNSVITNTGDILVTNLFNNNNGKVQSCGTISFTTFIGNPIESLKCFGTSTAYPDPTIGKSHDGKQVVENGICIDIKCWTVTANYHQDFKLVEILTDSTHTISTTVFCQQGVWRCNYVAFGVSPYGTNINDSVWKIILQKDHLGQWTMTVIDPDGYLGEVTSTTQIVNDGKHLSVSATIEFKKPTPGMVLNVELRDNKGGYRDFKFNDGIKIVDAYAYPLVETAYEPPLMIKKLCLNENPDKRYTCAFDKVRDWTIKNAEDALQKMINK